MATQKATSGKTETAYTTETPTDKVPTADELRLSDTSQDQPWRDNRDDDSRYDALIERIEALEARNDTTGAVTQSSLSDNVIGTVADEGMPSLADRVEALETWRNEHR
jgi:hypothetical protein